MVFLCFPMGFPWFSMVFYGFPMFSYGFLWVFYGFLWLFSLKTSWAIWVFLCFGAGGRFQVDAQFDRVQRVGPVPGVFDQPIDRRWFFSMVFFDG